MVVTAVSNGTENDTKVKIIPTEHEQKIQVEGDEDSRDNSGGKSGKHSGPRSGNGLLYNVTDMPPWQTCLVLGFQHYMAMFIGNLAAPFLLSDALCVKDDARVKAELVGVQFFVCGIITLLQVTIGVRLPIVQGSTFSLLVPTLSYLGLPSNTCPLILDNCTDHLLSSNITCITRGSSEYQDVWQSRLVTIQGSIMAACSLEIFLGASGMIGFLLRFIGPLTICPTISLLGLSLFKKSAEYGSQNWAVCAMTIVLLITFSQYMASVNIPLPSCDKKTGCGWKGYPFFKMFPVVLAVMLSWLVCYILTATDAIPADPAHWAYGARTDLQAGLITDTPWFQIFWPGKYGWPRFNLSLIVGLLAGFMASIVESVGDYYACASMAGAPPPPRHAINRGIMTEGLGCLLAGMFGTGNGSTSTSQNIGVIGLTRVGSRVVILYTGFIMMAFAVFNKFGSLFVTIPDPIIGAAFIMLFGMVVAVGLSNLQYVDMKSSRNLFVFGFSFFMGLTVSEWMKANTHSVDTGIELFDNVITVLLSTSMFVGGLLGLILDNTVPGTKKERGMLRQRPGTEGYVEHQVSEEAVYGLPLVGKRLKAVRWLRYVPICPVTFSDYSDSTDSNDKPLSSLEHEG